MDYQERATALRKRVALVRIEHGITQTELVERMSLIKYPPQLSMALTGTRQRADILDELESLLDAIEREYEAAA